MTRRRVLERPVALPLILLLALAAIAAGGAARTVVADQPPRGVEVAPYRWIPREAPPPAPHDQSDPGSGTV